MTINQEIKAKFKESAQKAISASELINSICDFVGDLKIKSAITSGYCASASISLDDSEDINNALALLKPVALVSLHSTSVQTHVKPVTAITKGDEALHHIIPANPVVIKETTSGVDNFTWWTQIGSELIQVGLPTKKHEKLVDVAPGAIINYPRGLCYTTPEFKNKYEPTSALTDWINKWNALKQQDITDGLAEHLFITHLWHHVLDRHYKVAQLQSNMDNLQPLNFHGIHTDIPEDRKIQIIEQANQLANEYPAVMQKMVADGNTVTEFLVKLFEEQGYTNESPVSRYILKQYVYDKTGVAVNAINWDSPLLTGRRSNVKVQFVTQAMFPEFVKGYTKSEKLLRLQDLNIEFDN